jgi:hypothetical protein
MENNAKLTLLGGLRAQLPGQPQITLLFVLVVTGILANWFWNLGWDYLRDPEAGLALRPATAVLVRVALGVIAAALTFIPVYRQIRETDAESWVDYFLAFQNGFFWEAALRAVVRQFTA